VILGNLGGSRPARVGRCLVVWTTGTTALAATALPAGPAAVDGWSARGRLTTVALDSALVDLAAVALLACLSWAWLALSVTIVEALGEIAAEAGRPRPPRVDARRARHPLRLPGGLRRLVLTCCGMALVAGVSQPALAAEGHPRPHPRGLAALAGLPLPDRAVAAPGPRRSPPRWITVRVGDSLWSIAAQDLSPDATAAEITERWHAIYAADRDVVGPDPDLLEPGQRLHLPLTDPPRKDPT
jgi:hypothetical protein